MGERSVTLEAGAKSETRDRKGKGGSKPSRGSRHRDPEARAKERQEAIVAAGGMDELQAELERMRQRDIRARGGSVDSSSSPLSPESVRASSPDPHLSAQAMLRQQSLELREPEPEPEVDAWGRPILQNTAADEYRPPHMLNPEKGEMLWLKPSTVAFDLGQPYGTDYRLHDNTVHECGSTVTGRVFDAGRPFQRSSVYVGQKERVVKKEGSGNRRRRSKAGGMAMQMAGLGDSSDEQDISPEELVQSLMSDPMQVEQMRSFAMAHLEQTISNAVIDEIRELTENGKMELTVKQIKPRKLVIPPEQVELGVKDNRQGMRIICEDLAFATEEFRFEIKGQRGLAEKMSITNDVGTAIAGFEELGIDVSFDVAMNAHGMPEAENAEVTVAVGPLELNVTASKNKRLFNRLIGHLEKPVRRHVEEEMNAQVNEHIDGLMEGLNLELQKHTMQEIRTQAVGGLQKARAGGAGWGGPPKGFARG